MTNEEVIGRAAVRVVGATGEACDARHSAACRRLSPLCCAVLRMGGSRRCAVPQPVSFSGVRCYHRVPYGVPLPSSLRQEDVTKLLQYMQ